MSDRINHELINDRLNQLEQLWENADNGPSVDELLKLMHDTTEPTRAKLKEDLIGIDLELRRKRQLPASCGHYLQAFPGDLELIVKCFRCCSEPPPEVGHYKLVRFIAEGAFGSVYEGSDSLLERPVAIKLQHPGMQIPFDNLEEARLAAKLNHPNILRIHQVYSDDIVGVAIVSELVRGISLDQWMRDHPRNRDPFQITRLMCSLAGALDHASSDDNDRRGIVHRDLKPGNILLEEVSDQAVYDENDYTVVQMGDDLYRPRLIDFGLSVNEIMQRQQPGIIAGSPSYMSPEQTRGETLRSSSDVWSLGVIWYELLTGEKPFQGNSKPEIFEQIRQANVRSIREINRNLPLRLDDICRGGPNDKKGCLRQSPSDRFTSRELVESLREFLADWRQTRDSRRNLGPIPEVISNPYRGLEAFRMEHADLFFGRNDMISRLFDKIRKLPLLAIVGPSGAGKSSLVQAGLLPRLCCAGWKIVSIRLYSNPVRNLTTAVRNLLPNPGDNLAVDYLANPGQFLADLKSIGHQRPGVVVYIDQFEELFTLTHADVKDQFLKCLLAPWLTHDQSPEVPLRLIISFRSEFQDIAMLHPDLQELLQSSSIQPVGQLLEREIREVINKPALRMGVKVNPLLEERIVADIGSDRGILPLLQYCLKRLWDEQRPGPGDELTLETYKQIRGFQGALSDHADDALEDLKQSGLADATRLLFKHLVQVDPDDSLRDARKPGKISDLKKLPIFGAPNIVDDVVASLTSLEKRLLVREEDQVEIAHEALIRQWTTLKTWVDEDRDFQIKLDRVKSFKRNTNEPIPVSLLRECESWLMESAKAAELDQETRAYVEACIDQVVRSQTRKLFESKTDKLLLVVEEFEFCDRTRRELLRLLRENSQQLDSEQRRRTALAALLLGDITQVGFLCASLLDVPHPEEFVVLNHGLAVHAETAVITLRGLLQSVDSTPGQRLRAVCALAQFNGHNASTREYMAEVADQLIHENPADVSEWAEFLMSERESLQAPLSAIAISTTRSEIDRFWAIHVINEFSRRPDVNDLKQQNWIKLLIDTAQDLAPTEYRALVPTIAKFADTATQHLNEILPANDNLGTSCHDVRNRRRARLAILYAQLKDFYYVSLWLRHDSDPSVKSHIIHMLAQLEIDIEAILRLLNQEMDEKNRIPLMLAVGEFGTSRLPESARTSNLSALMQTYRDGNTSAGAHGAAEWLLRAWGQEEWLAEVNSTWSRDEPGRTQRLAEIEATFKHNKDQMTPRWFVNSQGQTMVALHAIQPFRMGSPRGELKRHESEILHWRRIGRAFAISDKPVTWTQWNQFLKSIKHSTDKDVTRRNEDKSPHDECPVNFVSWYMAAWYCNWLSDLEGWDCCYEIAGSDLSKCTAWMHPGYLSNRNGYRLPTDVEMEFATRAGTTTARFFGETDELLSKYAWYAPNAQDRTWPVGRLKPNDWGLFDVQGNCFTWCLQIHNNYGVGPEHELSTDVLTYVAGQPFLEDKEGPLTVSEGKEDKEEQEGEEGKVVLRGGMYFDQSSDVRSAYRHGHPPTSRENFIGFRLARSLGPKSP